jgi:predicted nucleotidyltransferase
MLSELLEKVAQGLDARGVPYMVIGGQAVLVYGEPRMTRDIDVTLGVGPEGLAKVEDLVANLSLKMLPERPAEFVRERMVLPCKDENSGFRIDFIFSFTPYERQAIERARGIPIGASTVRFASPEDIVIHKLVAGRPRDLDDVRSILLKNATVDRAYIEHWLRQFDQALGRGTLESFRALQNSIKRLQGPEEGGEYAD